MSAVVLSQMMPSPQNLVYLCGPHGAGKDTLARLVAQAEPRVLVPELTTRTPPMPDDEFRRQYLKICQRAIEMYEYECIAAQHPNSVVLGNRCSIDYQAYRNAFERLGWISIEQSEVLTRVHAGLYDHSVRAIVLNPPFEVVQDHLRQRWQESRKKWREDNMDYLRAVCASYEIFKDKPGILYLREADPNSVIAWLHPILEKMKDPVVRIETQQLVLS